LEPLRQPLAAYFRRRIRDAAEIDDLVQEVFSRIIAREGDRPVEHLASYVFQTAASALTDRARRRAVRHTDSHVPFEPDRHGGQDGGPEYALAARDDLKTVAAALMRLPERTRNIFVLHRLEGYKYREIGEQLGISASAVEKHMLRAMLHLTQSLGNNREF
jgi:RNA polymerase sigma-70 factor (ECF subfamily)